MAEDVKVTNFPTTATKEDVAFKLLEALAQSDGKLATFSTRPMIKADKDWILDNYQDCLAAVCVQGHDWRGGRIRYDD